MQRRLTIALLGTALAAIVLVGFGVLGLSRIGAERDAREQLEIQLDAVAELAGRTAGDPDIGPAVSRLGASLENSTITIGRIDQVSGEITSARLALDVDLGAALDENALTQLLAGDEVVTRSGSQLRGVQLIDLGLNRERIITVVVIQREIAPIPAGVRAWFVLSGAVVLLGAALAASMLARRFADPIVHATAATRVIADGDLDVRLPVEGPAEFAELGASINAMAAELQRGRSAEQQFLLSVSHDLRTPLTALRGYGEALEDGTMTDTARAGAVITHNANRLSRLVGDLLDLGKLEARQFRFDNQRFDVTAVVNATASGHDPSAAERSVAVLTDSSHPVFVTADPDRVGQAVANLVENAVAFATSEVRVSVIARDGEAVIEVRDDGPGIDAADLPHVFERLYVTKLVPERSETSSGLGLAIVRELTEAMGGTVDARAAAGSGTAMVMTLPLSSSSGATGD